MRLSLTLLLSLHVFMALAQTPAKDNWEILAAVKFVPKHFKKADQYFLVPEFDEKIKKFENKRFVLKGHFIPIDMSSERMLIISRVPFAACFFCGGAGPESVVEVHLRAIPSRRFKTDQMLEVNGTLVLNDKDIEHMSFMLKDAFIVTK